MKEDFLHYLWRFKKFRISDLHLTTGESLTIINTGQYLQLAGPDFFNAQIIIDDQKWAGNVEIHLKSSDWYLHHHEVDKAYENVILHVVWSHDTDIFRANNSHIPVLELKHYVDPDLIHRYYYLTTPKSWIYCEQQLASVDPFIFKTWLSRLFVERLEQKIVPVIEMLSDTRDDWEAVLFYTLSKNFGLNTNGDAFLLAARSIPFAAVRKERSRIENLEAMLFGQAGMLEADFQDTYPRYLQEQYNYLRIKYKLETPGDAQVQFFKLRPDNFPTVRLSQLAAVYHCNVNLFTAVIKAEDIRSIYKLFEIRAHAYWDSHYQFDKPSPVKRKGLTRSFIELLIINTVVPLRFAYYKKLGVDAHEDLMALLLELPPECNAIVDKFEYFGIEATSAYESQALLQLKKMYCDAGRCLSCSIGSDLLKSTVAVRLKS